LRYPDWHVANFPCHGFGHHQDPGAGPGFAHRQDAGPSRNANEDAGEAPAAKS